MLILARKVPVLNALPQNGNTGIKKHRIILDAENRIKEVFIYFEKQLFLHRLLSWVKVIIIKIETKIDNVLHGIRKRAQKIDQELNDKK